MKKIILFALAILTATAVSAAPVDSQKAIEIARQFCNDAVSHRALRQAPASARMHVAYVFNNGAATQLYVIDRGAGNGYVIVAGDDRANEVLGYVAQGDFSISRLPLNMRQWLDGYARQIEFVQNHDGMRNVRSRIEAADSIAPLLGDIAWDQSSPYNRFSPISGTPTGCVATAMGQIMYYHRWPKRGTGSHSYVTTTRQVRDSADFNHTYDWDAMLPSLDASSPESAVTATATLLHDVGVAVDMDYDYGGSGAYSEKMAPALATYFGYDKGIRLVKRNYFETAEWEAMLRNELQNGRPVVYDGATSDLGSGHSFICDGYNKDGYYHINWGWGGPDNGYFLLTALTYESFNFQTGEAIHDGFNHYQDMLIDFKPDTAGTSVERPAEVIYEGLSNVDSTVRRGEEGPHAEAFEVYNTSNSPVDIEDLGLYIYDKDSTLVGVNSIYSGATPAGQYLDTLSTNLSIPDTLPEGDYKAYFRYRIGTGEEVYPALCAISANDHINIHVTADSVSFVSTGRPMFDISLSTDPDTLTSDKPATVTFHISNRGGEYDGALRFRLTMAENSHYQYTAPLQNVTILPGTEQDVVFSPTFTLPGDDHYVIELFDRANDVIFSDTIPVIGGEKDPELELTKEIKFVPRDYNVPSNCMILEATIRNNGGTYNGDMIARVFDGYWADDAAHMDTMHFVIPGNGAVTTVQLHGTYNSQESSSFSNERTVSIYDITGMGYLQPLRSYNSHEFTIGGVDNSVVWNPTTGLTMIPVRKDETAGPAYNLLGQRVNAGFRGVVIQDGKKKVVK